MSGSVIQLQTMRRSGSSDTESELGFERFSAMTAEDSNDTSGNSYQEGWIISYIDILTLLLTLFVILLAMSHFNPETDSKDQYDNNLSKSVQQPSRTIMNSSDNIQLSSLELTHAAQTSEKHKELSGSTTNPKKNTDGYSRC